MKNPILGRCNSPSQKAKAYYNWLPVSYKETLKSVVSFSAPSVVSYADQGEC